MKKFIRKNLSTIAVIFFVSSILLFSFNLFGRLNNSILTTIGCVLSAMGMVALLFDRDNKPKRGFEYVSNEMKKIKEPLCISLPIRSSVGSAGSDFFAPIDYTVEPNQIIKIWTGVKSYMMDDEFLMLDVRSSMGGKFMLANTIGIIDSSYYNNPDNEGEIGVFLKNISNETQTIQRGDRIAQGIFVEYLKADNDKTTAERIGGWGSSGR